MSSASDRMDLIALFIRLAETDSVSEAASLVGVSQPTASRMLQRLETIVGASLFDRTAYGLRMTQAGEGFLPPARLLMEQWQQAVDGIHRFERSISGTIRVAAPVAVGQFFLAALVARFLREHPNLIIEWHLSDERVDVIGDGFDLWLRAGDVHREDLIVREIFNVDRDVVAANPIEVDHPSELEQVPAVRLTPFVPGVVRLTSDDGEEYQLRQHATFMTNNLYAARSAVLEGVGYAILPTWCVGPYVNSGGLRRVCPRWRPPGVKFSIAYLPARGQILRVKALLDYLKRALGDIQFSNALEREAASSSAEPLSS